MEKTELSDPSLKSKIGFSRILITGIGKSGSTALFYSILKALPENTIQLFEPDNSKKTLPIDTLSPALVKSFVPYSENFSFFEKKILLVRDPRDNLISLLLYKPYNIIGKGYPGEKEKAIQLVQAFIESIRLRETGQSDISVRSLAEQIDVTPSKRMELVMDYYVRHPDVFVLKYEDYIDQKLEPLEDYLQMKLSRQVEIPSKFNRVARTKSYGNWRNWFTPSDVNYYKPLMHEYMERFGYKDDWELAEDAAIDPEQGSQYLESIIREAHELRRKRNI